VTNEIRRCVTLIETIADSKRTEEIEMTVSAAPVGAVGDEEGLGAVTVVLVGGQRLFLRGVELLLEKASGRLRVVGSTDKPVQAVELVRRHRPDVAVVDLPLTSSSALAVISELKRQWPRMRILATSEVADAETVVAALGAGADGLFLRSSEPEVLAAGLHSLAGGLSVIPPPVLSTLLEAVRRQAVPDHLSSEEQDLWRLVSEGLGTADIARRLFLSQRTTKRRMTALLRRLEVANRVQAAALAGRCGLLDASSTGAAGTAGLPALLARSTASTWS
jgi:two-component system nitrate/nitrite response regulator NarL